ncbi:hypothetical protein ABZS95_36795 [Streptomyces sp. NPDC005479]|uniref:hypothetical protein n=1 Tax=unclassified Streptomyces TaxID=2593676 RepID=UPI0033B6F557
MAVIDKPPIDKRTLTAEVAQAWGLDGVELVFLSIGLDGQAWAYRINIAGEDGYFMKVRRGEFAPAPYRCLNICARRVSPTWWHPWAHGPAKRGMSWAATEYSCIRFTVAGICGAAA